MNTETEQVRAVRAALHDLVADVTEPPDALERLRSELGMVAPARRRWARPRVLVPVAAAAVAAAVVGGLLLPGQQRPIGPIVVLASAVRSTPDPAAVATLDECVAITEQGIAEGEATGSSMVPVPATGWHVDAVLGAGQADGMLLAHNDNGDFGACELDHGKGMGLEDAALESGIPAGKVYTTDFGRSGGPDNVTQLGGLVAPDVSRIEVGTEQGTPLHAEVQVALGQHTWAVRIGHLSSTEAGQVVLRFYNAAGNVLYTGTLHYT